MTGHGRRSQVARITLAVALGIAMVVTWSLMMQQAEQAMYFEPTSEAVARANAAIPRGVTCAAVVAGAAAALALVTRSPQLLWLATPAVTTAALLIRAPHAAAFLLGALATAVGLLITSARWVRHQRVTHRHGGGRGHHGSVSHGVRPAPERS